MPIVNRHPITGKRESTCGSCGNFLVYNYSETLYVCSVCGKQYDPRNILSDLKEKGKSSKRVVETKILPTKKEKLKSEWGDIIDYFENERE